jgi:hypothetical protein
MMRPNTGGEIKISLIRFTALTITLLFVLLYVGLSASSANIEALEQHTVHLPLISKQSLWSDECIDCPHYFGGRSLDGAQIDSNGRVHVAYGGDQLYYASQDDNSHWVIQVVDVTPRTGALTSLGLDSLDHPHILYCDAGNDTWKYAAHGEFGWHLEILDIQCYEAAMVIDDQDQPHVAYTSETSDHTLHYGYQDAGSWHFESVDSDGGQLSLAVDSLGHPHIAYTYSNQELRYAAYDGSEWSITTIGDPGNSLEWPSIALDSPNISHISYLQSGVLKYAIKSGGEWQIETVDEPENIASFSHSSLALDQSGIPYVLYTVYDAYCIRSTCYDVITSKYRDADGNWLNSVGFDGCHSGTLLIDEANRIHVVYIDDGYWPASKLRAFSEGVGSSTIDQRQWVYGPLSLFADRNDELHSVYIRSGRVAYAGIENGSWQIEMRLEYAGSYWGKLQAAIGPSDAIYNAFPGFYSVYPGNFSTRYYISKQTDAGWTGRWIPDFGLTYAFDIAVDSHDIVHFSYFHSGTNYWYDPTSGTTVSENVDAEGGTTLSIAIDANDQPCIAFHTWSGIKFACKNGNGWTTEVVSDDNSYSISLEFDSLGQPHIVYIQGTENSGVIKHVFNRNNTWFVEPVAWITGDFSMAIDEQDYVHLSYIDEANDIIHAYRKAAGWSFERIDTSGHSIASTAITVDGLGNPHIAYIDGDLSDLRIIHYQPHQ